MGRLSPSSGQMAMPSRTSSSEDRVIFTFRAREGKSKQLCVVSCMSKRESGVTKAWKDQIGTRLLTVENLLMLKCKMFPLNSKDLKLESNCLSWPLGWKENRLPCWIFSVHLAVRRVKGQSKSSHVSWVYQFDLLHLCVFLQEGYLALFFVLFFFLS